MAKKIIGSLKLQVKAGQANPSPPVGPALGQRGLNIMMFVKEFNAKTADLPLGSPTPVVITYYQDKSFSLEFKTTPAVDGGLVYVADQKGAAMAVDAASGQVRWTAALGDEFMMCPVVTADKIIYGCRGGTLAVLNRADGKPVWSKKVSTKSFRPN